MTFVLNDICYKLHLFYMTFALNDIYFNWHLLQMTFELSVTMCLFTAQNIAAFISLCPSLRLCFYVSWFLDCLSICLSVHQPITLSVCFSVSVYVFYPIFYSLTSPLALPVHLSLSFSLYLTVYVSLSLSPSFSVFTSPPHSFNSYSPSLTSNLSFRFSVFLSVERFIENFPLHVEIFIFSRYRSFYQDPNRQTNSKSISSVCLRGHSVLSSLNCTEKKL